MKRVLIIFALAATAFAGSNAPINYDTATHQVKKPATAPGAPHDYDFTGVDVVGISGGGSSPVSSVFGRIGGITAQTGDYTFAQIGSKPTTLAGYGITNGQLDLTSDGTIELGITTPATQLIGVSNQLIPLQIVDLFPNNNDVILSYDQLANDTRQVSYDTIATHMFIDGFTDPSSGFTARFDGSVMTADSTVRIADGTSVTVNPIARGAGGAPSGTFFTAINTSGVVTLGYPDAASNTISADQNDFVLPTAAWYQRVTTDATRTFTGIVPQGTGGQTLFWTNFGSNPCVFANENTSSSAANRFRNDTNADITLNQRETLFMWYDSASFRWHVSKLGGASGGGGTPGGSNTQLQYNNAGAFGGITGATTNGTIVTLDSPVVTTAATFSAASISFTGNMSAPAWTTTGLRLKMSPVTLTDTTSSGTVAAAWTNAIGGSTIAATNATTFTDYVNFYLREPVAGTNVTLTNKWGLGADSAIIGTSNKFSVNSSGHATIEGTTSTGSTGTGKIMFGTTPDITTGFTIGGAAASGKIPIGNGTNYVSSTPTFPNASATSGKIIKSDGTNWVASTETYAAPGTSGNVMTSNGTNWVSSASAGGGNVSNFGSPTANQIAQFTDATHIQGVTPASPLSTGSGTFTLNVGTDFLFSVNQSIKINDATNNAVTPELTLQHDTTGTPANGLGAGISFFGETSTTAGQAMGQINTVWTDVTNSTRTSRMDFVQTHQGTAAAGTASLYSDSGSTFIDNCAIFRLTSDGSALGPSIADFFGTGSAFPTVANAIYEIEIETFFTKTTAGTVTFTLTNSQTYTNLIAHFWGTPVGGISAIGNMPTGGIDNTTTAAAALPTTSSMTAGTEQHYTIIALAEIGTAGTIKLQVTSSAGTVTPRRGCRMLVRRLPSGNVGGWQ